MNRHFGVLLQPRTLRQVVMVAMTGSRATLLVKTVADMGEEARMPRRNRGIRIPKLSGFETEKVTTMQRVFVLDKAGEPLMPCHPARARQLLRSGGAVCVRRQPFAIRLTEREGGDAQPMRLKADPGSRTTGLALTAYFEHRGWTAAWAAELAHRGRDVHRRLTERAGYRRTRRSRTTRYRAPRFNNRCRPAGWLPPSLASRVGNLAAWGRRLRRYAPVSDADVEVARFDTQRLQNPEITGVEYQRGELFGYEAREYILEKWGRRCAYCDVQSVPLEIDHIQSRSKRGSDRVSNLTLACRACNLAKNNRDVREFLAGKPKRLERILRRAKAPLRDAAAVNATRRATARALEAASYTVSCWTGGRTKYNRTRQGYPKTHWLDAACVGETGERVGLVGGLAALAIVSTGRGRRRVHRSDKHGFPKGAPRQRRQIHGFRTGDLVRLRKPNGKNRGVHTGRLAAARARGDFVLAASMGKSIEARWHRFLLVQRNDGYAYA